MPRCPWCATVTIQGALCHERTYHEIPCDGCGCAVKMIGGPREAETYCVACSTGDPEGEEYAQDHGSRDDGRERFCAD